ncbi:MAG: peptidylprolyl isomerase, partial [Rubritalea sp.]
MPDEANNGRIHVPYALSMAKTNAPHTGGSQFFFVDGGSSP